MRFLSIAMPLCGLCFPCQGVAAQPADSPATVAMIQLADGIPGERQEATVRLTATWGVPSVPDLAPIETTGHGTIEYFLSGQVIRFRCVALPPLRGQLDIKETTYQIRFTGLADTIAMIRWGNGTDITLANLGLQGTARQGDSRIATAARADIAMTTGTITVDGKTYRGAIDLAQQRVTIVGTFPMPHTGVDALDARLAGKAVVLQIEARPAPVNPKLTIIRRHDKAAETSGR